MRKRTVRTFLSALGGAVLGGVVVFSILVNLGKRSVERPIPALLPVPADTSRAVSPIEASPSASSPTPEIVTAPSPASDVGEVRFTLGLDLMVFFQLPKGYRVAATLNEFDGAQPGASPKLTVTSAAEGQEREYVKLVRDLHQARTVTEAPEFFPGRTVSLSFLAGESDEQFSAQLAKERMPVVSDHGLSGTRYKRVEGLYTYDVAYFHLGGGRAVAVAMSYAAEAPRFDEDAYSAVLNSLQLTEDGR